MLLFHVLFVYLLSFSFVSAKGSSLRKPMTRKLPKAVATTMATTILPTTESPPTSTVQATTTLPLPETVDKFDMQCRALKVFDNMGRYENNDKDTVGFDWNLLCDDFVPFNDLLCPSENYIEDICSMPFPFENRAVREMYCRPHFGSDAECMQACINFVSAAGNRGGCCPYTC